MRALRRRRRPTPAAAAYACVEIGPGNERQIRCSKAREPAPSYLLIANRRAPAMSPRSRRMPTPAVTMGWSRLRFTTSRSSGTSIGSRYSASRSMVRPSAVADAVCNRYSARYSGTKTKIGASRARRAKNSSSGVLMSGLNCKRLTSLVRMAQADIAILFRQTAAAGFASGPAASRSRPYCRVMADPSAARWPVHVDDVVIGKHDRDGCRRLRQHLSGKIRQQAIVVADDGDELSAGVCGDEVPVSGEAYPLGRLQVANARIRGGHTLRPRTELSAATVVANHDVDIVDSLRLCRCDSLAQKREPVVCRNADGESRRGQIRSSPGFRILETTLPPARAWDSDAPSSASRNALASRPPANPVSLPVAPITRWHGVTIEIGFLPFAAPTARTASGLPICLRDLAVRSRFAERDRQQRVPDFSLEHRAPRVQRHREARPAAGEILFELTLGLHDDRVLVAGAVDIQPHATRPVALPQELLPAHRRSRRASTCRRASPSICKHIAWLCSSLPLPLVHAPFVLNSRHDKRGGAAITRHFRPPIPCGCHVRKRLVKWLYGPVSWVHGPGPEALQGVGSSRPALRWRLLRRRDIDWHLLPSDLPGEDTQGCQLPVLRLRAGDRTGRLPSLPEVPARARSWQRSR